LGRDKTAAQERNQCGRFLHVTDLDRANPVTAISIGDLNEYTASTLLLLSTTAAVHANQQPKIEGWDLWGGLELVELAAGQPINAKAILSYGGNETTWGRTNTLGFFHWNVERVIASLWLRSL
jgi:hypothetical protein